MHKKLVLKMPLPYTKSIDFNNNLRRKIKNAEFLL